jgi:hypothetical protein
VGAALSGGVGGFFGVAAIAFELPLSTTIIMRSIADIARSEGKEVTSIDHFQDMAKGHFTIRELERIYGESEVKTVYDALPKPQ